MVKNVQMKISCLNLVIKLQMKISCLKHVYQPKNENKLFKTWLST